MGVLGVHSIGQISPDQLFLLCSTSVAFLSFSHLIYGSLCKQELSCLLPSQCSSWPREELSQSNMSSSPRTEISVLRWHQGQPTQLTQPGQSCPAGAQGQVGSAAPLLEAVRFMELRELSSAVCCILVLSLCPGSNEGYRPQ